MKFYIWYYYLKQAYAAPNTVVKPAATESFPVESKDLLFGWYFSSEQVVGSVDVLPEAASGAPPTFKGDHAVVVTTPSCQDGKCKVDPAYELSVWKVPDDESEVEQVDEAATMITGGEGIKLHHPKTVNLSSSKFNTFLEAEQQDHTGLWSFKWETDSRDLERLDIEWQHTGASRQNKLAKCGTDYATTFGGGNAVIYAAKGCEDTFLLLSTDGGSVLWSYELKNGTIMGNGKQVSDFGVIEHRPIICEWSNIFFVGRPGNCLIDRRTPSYLFFFTTSNGYLYSINQYANAPNWQWPVDDSPWKFSKLQTLRAPTLCQNSATDKSILFCGYIIMVGVKDGKGHLLQVSSTGRQAPIIDLHFENWETIPSPGVDYYANIVYAPMVSTRTGKTEVGLAMFTSGQAADSLNPIPTTFVPLPNATQLYTPVVCGSGSASVVFVSSREGVVYAIRSEFHKAWKSSLIWTANVTSSNAEPTCSGEYVYFPGKSDGFYAFRTGYYDHAGVLGCLTVFMVMALSIII